MLSTMERDRVMASRACGESETGAPWRATAITSAGETPAGPTVTVAAGVRIGGTGRELGAGQQRCDRVRTGQGVDVRCGQMGAVVGTGRVQLDREPHPVARAQLVRVDPQAQPGAPPGGEDGAGLVR